VRRRLLVRGVHLGECSNASRSLNTVFCSVMEPRGTRRCPGSRVAKRRRERIWLARLAWCLCGLLIVLAPVIFSFEAVDCVGVVVAVCAATTVVVASLCPALIKAAPARTCAVIDRYSWLCRDTSVTLVDYPAGRRSLHLSAPGSRPCHWTAESRPPAQRGLPVCAHEDGPLSTVASSVSRSRTGCRELEPRSLVSPRRRCTTCRRSGTCFASRCRSL